MEAANELKAKDISENSTTGTCLMLITTMSINSKRIVFNGVKLILYEWVKNQIWDSRFLIALLPYMPKCLIWCSTYSKGSRKTWAERENWSFFTLIVLIVILLTELKIHKSIRFIKVPSVSWQLKRLPIWASLKWSYPTQLKLNKGYVKIKLK